MRFNRLNMERELRPQTRVFVSSNSGIGSANRHSNAAPLLPFIIFMRAIFLSPVSLFVVYYDEHLALISVFPSIRFQLRILSLLFIPALNGSFALCNLEESRRRHDIRQCEGSLERLRLSSEFAAKILIGPHPHRI